MLKPSIVVFDLGGVVVRICRSWKEACERVGLPFHEAAVDTARVAERKGIRHLHETGAMDDDEFYIRLAATTAGHYTPVQVRAIHDGWITGEYPGVDRLIDDLHTAGLQTGILSNTNNHHWLQMTAPLNGATGPSKFPTVQRPRNAHASHLLRLAKPHVAVYDAFAAASGFQPHQILFFDDTDVNIAGAIEAGWDAVQIDHAADTASQMRLHLRLRGVDV